MLKPQHELLVEVDEWNWEVGSRATDYPTDWFIEPHSHAKHQLIYATKGLMIVESGNERWTVPQPRRMDALRPGARDTLRGRCENAQCVRAHRRGSAVAPCRARRSASRHCSAS